MGRIGKLRDRLDDNVQAREVMKRVKDLFATVLFFAFGFLILYLSSLAGAYWWIVVIAGAVLLISIFLFWPVIRTFRYGIKDRPRRAA